MPRGNVVNNSTNGQATARLSNSMLYHAAQRRLGEICTANGLIILAHGPGRARSLRSNTLSGHTPYACGRTSVSRAGSVARLSHWLIPPHRLVNLTSPYPQVIDESCLPACMHGVNAVRGTSHLFNLLALLPIPCSSPYPSTVAA